MNFFSQSLKTVSSTLILAISLQVIGPVASAHANDREKEIAAFTAQIERLEQEVNADKEALNSVQNSLNHAEAASRTTKIVTFSLVSLTTIGIYAMIKGAGKLGNADAAQGVAMVSILGMIVDAVFVVGGGIAITLTNRQVNKIQAKVNEARTEYKTQKAKLDTMKATLKLLQAG